MIRLHIFRLVLIFVVVDIFCLVIFIGSGCIGLHWYWVFGRYSEIWLDRVRFG